jgi:hypothetical protein
VSDIKLLLTLRIIADLECAKCLLCRAYEVV